LHSLENGENVVESREVLPGELNCRAACLHSIGEDWLIGRAKSHLAIRRSLGVCTAKKISSNLNFQSVCWRNFEWNGQTGENSIFNDFFLSAN